VAERRTRRTCHWGREASRLGLGALRAGAGGPTAFGEPVSEWWEIVGQELLVDGKFFKNQKK